MPVESNQGSEFLPLTEATYFIMLSLVEPRHGYGIMQYVRELTRGGVRIGAGTLYGALATLQERNLIVPAESPGDHVGDGSRQRRVYVLTRLGRQVLGLELERQKALVSIGESILKEGGDSQDGKQKQQG